MIAGRGGGNKSAHSPADDATIPGKGRVHHARQNSDHRIRLHVCVYRARISATTRSVRPTTAIGSAALSPDGKRIAVSVGYEYRSTEPDRELTSLSIIDIDSGKVDHTLAPPPKNTLRGVGWADEKRPYYFISGTMRARDLMPASMPIMIAGPRVEVVRTGVLSIDTGKMTLLLTNESNRGQSAITSLLAPVEGDPGFGRMIAWGGLGTMNNMPKLSVYRVNLDSGAGTAPEQPRRTLAVSCSMSGAPPSPASTSTMTRIAGVCSATRTARTA